MNQTKNTEVAVVDNRKPTKGKIKAARKQNPSNLPLTMEGVFMEAVQLGYDPEGLRILVELKERLENKANEKLFNEALALAQKEMKPVRPSGFNQQTSSEYPKLEEVNTMAMPIATKHGFSLSCTEEESKKEGHIRIAGTLSHSAGHSRKYSVDLPLDQKGIKGTVNKTLIHATGSTFTYGRRYLTMMIFNISIVGADDDGQAAGKTDQKSQESNGLITDTNVKKITAMIDKSASLETLILAAYNVATIELIKKADFQDCVQRIENWKTANKKPIS